MSAPATFYARAEGFVLGICEVRALGAVVTEFAGTAILVVMIWVWSSGCER